MELPDARNKFTQVRQKGLAWCIPASFEVLIRYFNLLQPTQEDMVRQYHKLFGHEGYGEPVILNGELKFRHVKLDSPTIEQLAKHGFPKGDFNSFQTIANSLLAADCGRRFEHPADCDQKFEEHMLKAMTDGDGFLGVIKNPDGNCHILPIIGFDGTTVVYYDPGSGDITTKAIKEVSFNRDCIIFKKIQ
jgi:hypothetical protein